jgi:hypothetical protein
VTCTLFRDGGQLTPPSVQQNQQLLEQSNWHQLKASRHRPTIACQIKGDLVVHLLFYRMLHVERINATEDLFLQDMISCVSLMFPLQAFPATPFDGCNWRLGSHVQCNSRLTTDPHSDQMNTKQHELLINAATRVFLQCLRPLSVTNFSSITTDLTIPAETGDRSKACSDLCCFPPTGSSWGSCQAPPIARLRCGAGGRWRRLPGGGGRLPSAR